MPTIRRIPRKSLDARIPSEREVQIWEKHRIRRKKSIKIPPPSNK